MLLSDAILEQIKQAAAKIAYGRITIEINETSKTVDIIVERRLRIDKDEPIAGKLIVHS
jgi:hypothetical protein